jgi:hypothetical protein
MNKVDLRHRIFISITWITEILHRASTNRFVRGIFSTLALLFCGWYLYQNRANFTQVISLNQVHIPLILLSTLLVWVTVFSGSLIWYLTLRGLGVSFPFFAAIRTHLNSNVVKYLPGIIWQYVYKYASLDPEQSGWSIPAKAIIVEFGMIIVTGMINILIVFPKTISSFWLPWLAWGLLLLVLASPFILKLLIKGTVSFFPFFFSLAILLLFVNWNVLGLSLWVADAAIYPLSTRNIPIYTFSITISVVGGILILPIPQGIGVREGLMAFLLQTLAKTPDALILTGLSRLQIISAELLMAGTAWIITRVWN